MKVTVVFDFPEINDASSTLADDVVNMLTQNTVEWQNWLRELLCDDDVSVWVDEATSRNTQERV